MNKQNQALLLGIQAAMLAGSLSPAHAASDGILTVDAQQLAHQTTLKSVSESWMLVPRVCKAQNFNAHPVALSTELRSEAIASLYSF